MLDLFFRCAHNSPTYAARLIAAQADGLRAERENARLKRTVECLQDWFARASRRADAMEQARDLTAAANVRLETERTNAQACLTQALAEKADLTAHVLALEEEVLTATKSADNLMDIADGLRNELKAVKAKKKGRT